MIGAERLKRISERLCTEHVVSIASLSNELKVSEMTIRRDLRQLEMMGLCRRTHGGAVSLRGLLVQDMPYSEREYLYVAEKVAIGHAAAELVKEGETIAIDAGTTTAQMAAALVGRQNITVITNSLRVLNHLCNSPGITVISTGGSVSTAVNEEPGRADPCLVGPLAEATLRRFRPNKAFMGTTGLTITDGLSNSVIEQAELKRLMMELSAEVILLADHSKFGRVASAIAGPVTMLHRVITDSGISPQMKRALEELGIEVIVVEPAKDVLVVPGFVAAQGDVEKRDR
jgi:DeoR/GlpR family transcriptional regulator of sugar metabolism